MLRIVLILLLAAPAAAQSVDDLKAKAAVALGKRDYKAALVHLEAAYALDPQPDLSANIGFVQYNLGRYPKAAAAFERFLNTEPPPPPAKAERAQSLLDRIKPVIKLRSDPLGATVDGPKGMLGRTPVTLRLLAGKHSLKLTKPGFAPLKLEFEVREGRSDTILRTLIPTEAGPKVIGTQAMDDDRPVRVAPWIALAGTVVAGAGAATFYSLTGDAVDQRDKARTGSAWDSHQVDAETWNTAMWTSVGVAAVTAGVTAWLFSR